MGLKSGSCFQRNGSGNISDRWADAHQWLLRQVAYMETRHTVQTCRGVPPESPWYPAYLALFGNLPEDPHPKRNRLNELRDDLAFADVVDIASVDAQPSVRDIVSRMLNPQ